MTHNAKTVVDGPAKAKRLEQLVRQDGRKLVKLVIRFDSNIEKSWFRENEFAQLIKQCRNLRELEFHDCKYFGQYSSRFKASIGVQLYDSLTKLDQLELFAYFGPCSFPEMRGRTLKR